MEVSVDDDPVYAVATDYANFTRGSRKSCKRRSLKANTLDIGGKGAWSDN